MNFDSGPTEYILSIGLGCDVAYSLNTKNKLIGSFRIKRLGANRFLEQILPEPTVHDIRLDVLSLDVRYRFFPTLKTFFVDLGGGINYIANVSNEGMENFDVITLSSKQRWTPSSSLGIGYKFAEGQTISFIWHESLNDFYSIPFIDFFGELTEFRAKFRSIDLSYTMTFNGFKKFWKND